MDREKFFDALRKRDSGVFGTSLTQAQVKGVEALLDACQSEGATLEQAAYILATPYGETGGKMQPVRENLNYSASQIAKHFGAHRRQGYTPEQLARNPKLLGNTVYGGEWGRKNLGNTEPGDGFRFRGWGLGQHTGRRNTEKAGRDVGLDLISNPELLEDVQINALLVARWMLRGTATGRKLSDFINEAKTDYRGARAVWGGVDPAKYVTYAKAFEKALHEAGYKPRTEAPKAAPAPDPQEQPTSILTALISALLSLFGGKR